MEEDEETKTKTFKLTKAEEKALQALAQAGYVMYPDRFQDRTEVSVVRRMIRDAWEKYFPGLPFPEGD